jgi:hypothetical protein
MSLKSHSNADLNPTPLNNPWLHSADLGDANGLNAAGWTGAKYSLNAVDNNNPIAGPRSRSSFGEATRSLVRHALPGVIALRIVRLRSFRYVMQTEKRTDYETTVTPW